MRTSTIDRRHTAPAWGAADAAGAAQPRTGPI